MKGLQGFLPLLKPPGMTSSDAVVHVRRMLPKGTKIGHAGTLDPMAAGVLPLMVGKATRLFDEATAGDKQYIAALCFGWSTDTQDQTGTVLKQSGHRPETGALEAVLRSFLGDSLQVPPAYSALKQDGVRLYELARKGTMVEREPRPIHLSECCLLERLSPQEALIRVTCSKGTYIRTLCADIGEKLGCPAHMGFLLRTRAGAFTLDAALPIESLAPETLPEQLLPMDAPLHHLPRIDIPAEAKFLCRNGAMIPRSFFSPSPEIAQGSRARLYLQDAFVGLVRVTDQGCVFDAMLKEWEES